MNQLITEEARALNGQIVEWRRLFHQCPELKMETPVTSAHIAEILRGIGIEDVTAGIGGNGVAAVIRGGRPGLCLGIRSDCDGLPIPENTGLPFASVNGNMHACGHDGHIAMALGAAKLLYGHRSELAGSVKVFFQPYEEGAGGAPAMIEAGILENPHVDALIALHTGNLLNEDSLRPGDVSYVRQAASAAIRTYGVTFRGTATHAATPHKGHDPILAACYAVSQIQGILSRIKAPASPAVVSVNVIRGGVRNNIVPDTCYIEGTIRSGRMEEQDLFYQSIRTICENTAASFGCTAEIQQIFDVPPTVIDRELLETFLRIAPDVVGPDRVLAYEEPVMSGEDFAYYSHKVPSLYFFHCAKFGDARDYPHHNARFDLNEETLWSGAALFAQFALNWQTGMADA